MHRNSKIFEYRKLRDFEKVLFLEKQVRTLIRDLKAARYECGILKSELAEKIDTDEKNRKIYNQREYIKRLEISQRKLKVENSSLMYKLGKALRGNSIKVCTNCGASNPTKTYDGHWCSLCDNEMN